MTKLTFLGTGTSQGVPVIACGCWVCTSPDPRDQRLRTSALVEHNGVTVVIDAGPDFRQQMLRQRVRRIDAILLKLDDASGALAWERTLGDDADYYCTTNGYTAVAADTEGAVYAVGYTTIAPHFRGAVIMSSLLTMSLYQIASEEMPFSPSRFAGILLYILIPIFVILDWALFTRKGRFVSSDPVIWLIVPFLLYAVVLVAAQAGVHYYNDHIYPYSVIDSDVIGIGIGWARVLVHVALITAAYLVGSYILYGIDHHLAARAKKRLLAAKQAMPLDIGTAPNQAGTTYDAPSEPPAESAAPEPFPASEPEPYSAPDAPPPEADVALSADKGAAF